MSVAEKNSESLNKPYTLMNSIESEAFKRKLLWHGIFLCTLGFIVGLFIPLYANPRAGLATHLLGITEGLFLVAIGFCYGELKLPLVVAKLNFWMLLVSAYFGLFGEFLGATLGVNRILVVTGIGLPENNPWLETSIELIIKCISIFILLSCFIVLFGLRGTKSNSNL
ncbi:MAG: hypothetical protein AAFW70_18985 [Cyanobacteria bacterium J06635_10]